MNNFVESNYDSFEKKTKVNLKQPIPVTICNDCLGVERIGISYTIEQAANSDAEISLIVILGTQNPDLRIDEFLIKLNDEELLRCEIVAGFEGKGLVCILSISDLEKICDAQSVEMRIKNSEGHTDFTSDEIKFGAQVVYNAFVDENAYIEDIQKREKELVELQQKLESEKLSETKKFNQRIERIRTKGVNKFFTTDYDKFNQKLTVYLKEAVELKGIEGSLLILESKVSFLFVYINEELPVLVIDFRAISRSGLNLKNGELLLLIDDKKRLSLEPHESFSDTHLQDFHIESDWYAISEDELKALCEARIIEMRITNGNEYQDIATKGLQEAARRFYNAVIDDTTYTDELLTQEEREAAERERQRQEYLAEQERLRKEREAKEAEEARIRAEKRAEWWRQNGKKVWITITIIVLAIIAIVVGTKIAAAQKLKHAEQEVASLFALGDKCAISYDFEEAEKYYNEALKFIEIPTIEQEVSNKNLNLTSQKKKADDEYKAALKKLKILLEADDYVFNQYSNECLDKMIEIYPKKKETIYYKNMRNK